MKMVGRTSAVTKDYIITYNTSVFAVTTRLTRFGDSHPAALWGPVHEAGLPCHLSKPN